MALIGLWLTCRVAGTLSAEPMEAVEFGRRLAVEREIEHPAVRPRISVIFDESGTFGNDPTL